MIEMGNLDNFEVETKGQCFFCLEEITPERSLVKTEPGSFREPSTNISYSVKCLSSYLKINMRKVFYDGGSISNKLSDKVRKSTLRAELCEKCVLINDKFSALYRQLEKIELEMAFWLNHIQSKLGKDGSEVKTNRVTEFSSGEELFEWGKLQIAEALRKETFHKCSKKLDNSVPRVRIQNMSQVKVAKERRKIKFAHNKTVAVTNHQYITIERKTGATPSDQNFVIRNTKLDKSVKSDEDCSEWDPASPPPHSPSSSEPDHDGGEIDPSGDDELVEDKVERSDREVGTDTMPSPLLFLPSTKATDKPVAIKYTINPKTHKFMCSICSMEYTRRANLIQHHNNIHLNIKDECDCGKKFLYSQHYNRHYRSHHMGLKFSCGECGKEFAQNSNLKTHYKTQHLKAKEFECNICDRAFGPGSELNGHIKIYH